MQLISSCTGRKLMLAALFVATECLIGCGSLSMLGTDRQDVHVQVEPQSREPELVRLSVLVTPRSKRVLDEGSRIVIAEISETPWATEKAFCANAVKDALMRRLIENAGYDVLSRDELQWIFDESENNWSGRFDTETVTELGKLLGASYYIVGRISYCGYTAVDSMEEDPEIQFSIFASLQIIDLELGKVLVSSASEGTYLPPSSTLATLMTIPSQGSKPMSTGARQQGTMDRFKEQASQMFSWLSPDDLKDEPKESAPPHPVDQYQMFRAAEDLANSFADNFFARPVWQTVEMWNEPRWRHSDAIHFVKFGDCEKALALIEGKGAAEAKRMNELELSRYLHNYGVALMCANDIDRAVEKLRSSYRLGYNDSTLKMLGIAGKAKEWSLYTEEDQQEEVDDLIDRSLVILSGSAP